MASDDFNRANGAIGANWTVQAGSSPVVASNHCKEGGSGEDEFAFYSASTFAPNQESSVEVTFNDAFYGGVTVRASGTAGSRNNYYFLTDGTGFSSLGKTVAGSASEISSTFAHPASGSVIKLKAEGSTLTVYDDGVLIGTFVDASLSTGNPGIYCNGGGGGASYIDNWIGAEVGGGGGSTNTPAKIIFERAA